MLRIGASFVGAVDDAVRVHLLGAVASVVILAAAELSGGLVAHATVTHTLSDAVRYEVVSRECQDLRSKECS